MRATSQNQLTADVRRRTQKLQRDMAAVKEEYLQERAALQRKFTEIMLKLDRDYVERSTALSQEIAWQLRGEKGAGRRQAEARSYQPSAIAG